MRKLLLLMSKVRIFIIFVPLLSSCRNSENHKVNAETIITQSLDAVGQKASRDKIETIIAFANCTSPKGNYTTQIHTSAKGYSYFKQTYSYNPQDFEVKIYNNTKGFVVGDSTQPLTKEAIFAIKSHEFYNLILDIHERFNDFSEPEELKADKQPVYRIAAKDELNHLSLLFFDKRTGFLNEIHLQNPENEKELLIIRFSDWKKVDDLQLPTHILINQSEKLYTFDFTQIRFNAPDFEKITLK
ncbi:DUF4292 domain-containing protein [Emticicia agri]|uniref:DUF4292 domain-containing protein n=1 Tax=Emticicia agri TaxID=2492393 RepID=A0A4Q5LWF6_9BACT|nr:DUF4292 domain-containing protein [Emticicia agri]RYU93899.1 DUF4292 domain-containing protein [Emticicia agri]